VITLGGALCIVSLEVLIMLGTLAVALVSNSPGP